MKLLVLTDKYFPRPYANAMCAQDLIRVWSQQGHTVDVIAYADYDGTPHAGHQEIFGRHDWYYSDAYRTIANIAMDHLWYDKDPWQTEIANRLQKFYCEEQREHWDGVFLIDGTRLEEKALHPVAIVAVNAQASLAADGPHIKECVDRFWNTPLRTGDRRYYDNFLYLFAMLALSGNYRIYK